MIARRILRAAVRTTRRITLPLRLRWIDHCAACSRAEIERLLDLRDDLNKRCPAKYLASQLEYVGWLEQIEHLNLVKLDKRRQEIVRWDA